MMLPSYLKLVVLFLSIAVSGSGNVEQTLLRGVQPSLLSMYIPSKPFTCLDGSSSIPFEFVNDDYCDCRDGSDEPGTSACPNGRFFCENKGYIGAAIPSHFVGDGVCDCCDGSDEYETTVVCNNTCFVLAQKNQAEREAKRLLHAAGVAKKKEIIAKAVVLKSDRRIRIDELEQKLQQIENELKEKAELKRQAEEPENEAKEKHQKIWEEQRAARELIVRDHQMREMFVDLDTNHDSVVSIDEFQKHTELDTDHENEFTVEEVRSILGADSVDLTEFNNTVFEQISNSYKKIPDPTMATPEPTPLAEPAFDSITTEAPTPVTMIDEEETTPTITAGDRDDEDREGDYEDDFNDHESHTPATSLDHQKSIHDDTVPEYDDETKKLIQIADQARNDFNEVERRVGDIKREIEDLKKQSDVDIGPQGEFATMIDQCFDYEEREYTYRLCVFKNAVQIPKGGGSEVTVGHWEGWTGPANNKYSTMKYTNGATCWNGPSRSLTVTLKCGIENRAVDVREPTRCEYAMNFESPSVCDETIANTPPHVDHTEF